MPDRNRIVRERQLTIRRQLDKRGISLKAVSLDSDLSYSTVVSYFPGEKDREPATIGGAALFSLLEGEAVPLDLLSLLLPDGYQIVRVPEGIDHDAMCEAASLYVAEKHRAHHPDSEDGRDLGPGEVASLDRHAVQLMVLAA